jgi:GT2 family glycosyltransferase
VAPNASDARNKGFLASSGQFILFIDDDLVPDDGFCAKAMAVFRDYPLVDCFSPLVYSAEGKELALKHAKIKWIASLVQNPEIFSITDTISAALFFKREYFERTGGFDPMLFEFAKTAEDQELFLRMRKKNLPLYFVPFVEIYHDESIPGGCELRTEDYWISREKFMKAWAYRHRIHHQPPGSLSIKDSIRLARSGFLNKEVLSSGFREVRRQMKLLIGSVRASGTFLKPRLNKYLPVQEMDHLASISALAGRAGKTFK